MTLATGATINIDADEITEMLDDETANRLDITDQNITVDNGDTISAATAKLLAETTTEQSLQYRNHSKSV